MTVFQTLDLAQLQAALGLLGGCGLEARLADSVMGTAFPVALSGIGRIQVRESQARLAKEILDQGSRPGGDKRS